MENLIFLQDMAIVMAVSAVIMLICHWLRLPVVLGYILAGVLIGPHTPPFPLVRDLHNIHVLSELGVIFLLFSIGLEFSFSKLMKVGFVALVAATVEILLMIWIGYSLGRAFGWNFMNSLFLGAILSISSTTIIAKVLIEMKKIKEKFAQVILGILIVEDLLAIVIIAVLSGIASTGSLEMESALMAMVKVVTFVAGVLFFGYLIVPRLLRYLAKFDSSEMMIISVLGLCFGVSLLTARLGFSVALGAFLIGAIIAETKQVKDIIHKMEPIRDMFTAVFFVSVGMLINPAVLEKLWFPILIITLVTIVGKVISCSSAAFLTGYKGETALKVGLGLAQIGEFSFIIARLGETTKVTSDFLYPTIVAVSAMTTLTTPLLMKNTSRIIAGLSWLTPKPLLTILNLYTGWFERLGGAGSPSEKKAAVTKGLKIYLPRLIFYAIGACAVVYGAAWLQNRSQTFPEPVYWGLLGVLILPFFLGFVYTLDQILWNVLFTNFKRPNAENDEEVDIKGIRRNIVRFILFLAVGVVFIFAGASFLTRLPLVIAAIGLVLISGLFFWGAIRKVHERVEKTVLAVFDQEKSAEAAQNNAAREELVKLIQHEYPWDVSTQDFLLPYQESAVNQSISDLRLRSHSGASIVAIYREENTILNPSPEIKLMPGDVLLLMGDQEQIKAAIKFLQQKLKEPAIYRERQGAARTQTFQVQSASECIGKSIHEMKLRRKTGVNVLGIQKSESTINNPDPETVLEEGDTLILFGRPDQIELAEHLLSIKKPE